MHARNQQSDSPVPADPAGAAAGTTDSPKTDIRTRSLWRSRTYRNWFAADTADVFAVSLRTFAIPLIGLAVSGSPFVAGLLVAVESTIGLVLMTVGGALADRHDKRTLMILLGLAGLALSSIAAVLLAADAMGTPMFSILVVLFAVMNGLLGPANDAMLKSIVPQERFAKAQAVREARESCVELSGGTLGGLLYRIAGWGPFLVSAILYLVAAITALTLPKRGIRAVAGIESAGRPDESSTRPSSGSSDPSFLRQFMEGWRWTLSRRIVLAAIVQGAVINVACYGSIIGVQIMLAARGTDAALIGLVGTATGVSSLIGSLAAGRLVEHMRTGHLIILTFTVFTIAMIPLVFTDSYAVAVICMSVASVLFPALNAGELGFIYGRTPEHMQGRVSTVFETTIGVPGALTPALVGWLLQVPGLGFHAAMLMVVLCAALGLLLACVTPTRHIPKPDRWEQVEL